MIIKTYKELEEYIKMFKSQTADLLIIISKAGLGKTTTLRKVMGNSDFVYINTHSSPLKTYIDLYEHCDEPVCFDDISILLKNQIMVSMLKSLADTASIKELHYNTTSKLIGNAPESFRTTSNVCILLNEFDAKNKDLEPLLDRGFLVEFSPTKKEILKKIEKINKSESMTDLKKYVYDFIKENCQKIEKLSIRTYIKAAQLFRDNPDKWKERFMQMIGFDEKLIEYLKLKEKYKTDKEMIDKFSWGRSTFYRIKQESKE